MILLIFHSDQYYITSVIDIYPTSVIIYLFIYVFKRYSKFAFEVYLIYKKEGHLTSNLISYYVTSVVPFITDTFLKYSSI